MNKNEIEVVDIKTLRQKYIGARFNEGELDKFEYILDKTTGRTELEFSYLEKWTGNEYNYVVSFCVNEEREITKLFAPKCQMLVGDDARGSSYKGHRCDDFDYWQIDKKLSAAVTLAKGEENHG